MLAKREYQQACRLARQVLEELEAHRLSPSPTNYALWFVHLSGEHPALSAAVRALLAGAGPLDAAACVELHERFLLPGAEERTLLQAGQRLNELTSELTREVTAFGTDTARYGMTLDAANRGFAGLSNAERIHTILRGIIAETMRMQGQAGQIEGHLRVRLGEIDDLRREVQAAWIEARTDGLTGLANRKQFDEALRTAAEQAAPVCLLLADIDHFKLFNDQFGHALGDQVLKLVAAVLSRNLKAQDLVARIGGEEFAVILPETRLEEARDLAETLCDSVASRQIVLKDSSRTLGRVTLSIGVAERLADEGGSRWLTRADEALYAAKHSGRNRVVADSTACRPA